MSISDPQLEKSEGDPFPGQLTEADGLGQITVNGALRGQAYLIPHQQNGEILNSPIVVRHAREAWLFENPEALASVRKGLEEAARGELHDLGSFAQYADIEID